MRSPRRPVPQSRSLLRSTLALARSWSRSSRCSRPPRAGLALPVSRPASGYVGRSACVLYAAAVSLRRRAERLDTHMSRDDSPLYLSPDKAHHVVKPRAAGDRSGNTCAKAGHSGPPEVIRLPSTGGLFGAGATMGPPDPPRTAEIRDAGIRPKPLGDRKSSRPVSAKLGFLRTSNLRAEVRLLPGPLGLRRSSKPA
jgi:hypothetical protein